MDQAWKPNVEISPSCPRCGSSNTKFCYYNNYSLTQPRYFCKGCRRYWTKGGSLRNVPIGGGCRKNRRAKSLRLSSTDHHVPNNHSKSLGYGGFSTCDSPTHSYKGTSSSSSTISDGSHIDLALVYANFLNPQPVSKTSNLSSNFGMQELGSSDFDPSLDFTNLESNLPAGCISTAMEAHLVDNDHQLMYYYGMDSLLEHNKHQADANHKIQQCTTNEHLNDTINCGLPPLPGEEVGSLWSNSDHNHNLNHTMQVTQEPVLGPETHDPNSLLMDDWSPFDLSSDDTFSRT